MSHISHFESLRRREEEATAVAASAAVSATPRRTGEPSKKNPAGGFQTPSILQFCTPVVGRDAAAAAASKGAKGKKASAATALMSSTGTPALLESSKLCKRYQPYTRRIAVLQDPGVDFEAEKHEEEISNICHRTWQVYSVSPLFGLGQGSESVLAAWQRSLQSDLDALGGADVDYRSLRAEIRTARGLRARDSDSPAVQISVFSRGGRDCVAVAILVATDADEDVPAGIADCEGMAILPVLLLQASSAEVKKTVLANLRKCFDCVIHNMGITEDDMRWASAMWTGLKHSGKNSKDISKDDSESDLRLEGDCGDAEDGAVENNVKNLTPDSKVKFMYSLPETTTSPCTMEMELNQSQLHDMWMSIHDPVEYEATVEEVDVFHECLRCHLHRTMGMDLGKLTLRKIVMPLLQMDSTGKVRLKSPEHAKTVLKFLTMICQMKLETILPRLAITSGESLI